MSELQVAVDRPGFTLKLRDMSSVAICTRCKGGSSLWHRIAGDLHLVGWQLSQERMCPQCDGAGYWREAA